MLLASVGMNYFCSVARTNDTVAKAVASPGISKAVYKNRFDILLTEPRTQHVEQRVKLWIEGDACDPLLAATSFAGLMLDAMISHLIPGQSDQIRASEACERRQTHTVHHVCRGYLGQLLKILVRRTS